MYREKQLNSEIGVVKTGLNPTMRILFCDIDGTLLTSDHAIRPETKASFETVKKRGIPIVLASARSPNGMIDIMQEIGVSGHFISFSGALIGKYDYLTDEINFEEEQGIPTATAVEVAQRALDARFSVGWYTKHNWYITQMDERIEEEAIITQQIPVQTESFQCITEDALKILCIGNSMSTESLNIFRRNLPLNCHGDLSGINWLEVMKDGVNKGAAAVQLCNLLGVPMNQAMAVGDGENDLELIRVAGFGVAMGNAMPLVKCSADYVTKDNDSTGLADAIQKWILDM